MKDLLVSDVILHQASRCASNINPSLWRAWRLAATDVTLPLDNVGSHFKLILTTCSQVYGSAFFRIVELQTPPDLKRIRNFTTMA